MSAASFISIGKEVISFAGYDGSSFNLHSGRAGHGGYVLLASFTFSNAYLRKFGKFTVS